LPAARAFHPDFTDQAQVVARSAAIDP